MLHRTLFDNPLGEAAISENVEVQSTSQHSEPYRRLPTHTAATVWGHSISKDRLFPVLHWGGWTVFGAIPFVWTVQYWGFFAALLNNTLCVLAGGLVSLGLRVAYRRARTSKISPFALAIGVLIACALLAEVWYAGELIAARWCFQHLASVRSLHDLFAFGEAQMNQASFVMSVTLWVIYCFALLTWSSLYFAINNAMALQLEQSRLAFALKLADAARLTVLQAQLHPHFLFNSLNGAATLIRENDDVAAANMVATLSDFLQATLRTVNVSEIPVSQELTFIDQYVELQQMRFADLLKVHVDVSEDTYNALIPTLILQPLVENAVQHGVLNQEQGGAVFISVRKLGNDLVASVDDDGPGPVGSGPSELGVGLTNTAERLRALYGDHASMKYGRSTRGGFSVVLHIPFCEQKPAPSVSRPNHVIPQ